MSLRSFNPDGGDLGLPDPYPDKNIPFPEHAEKAAKFLSLVKALADLSGLKQHFSYALMLPLDISERKMDELLLRQVRLPYNVTWFIVDGKKLFELRGASGGVATSKVCYLISTD